MRPTLATTLISCALFATAAPAHAGDGAAEAPSHGGVGSGEADNPRQAIDRDAAEAGRKPAKPEPKRPQPPERRATGAGGHPLLTSFTVSSSRVYLYGRAARVQFQVDDRAESVAVRLAVLSAATGETVRTIDLGERATGVPHSYRFTAREDGALPVGTYRIRLHARDARGHALVRRAGTSAVDEIAVYSHSFPLRGNFVYGDAGSRFGAKRSGHSHQGQDIAAPEGTHVRAPRGGVVKSVQYQAGGAGHYIVIDAAGEDRDYVFMHLQEGSIRVRQGQRVRTGAWIANVGNTGRSFGAHLHFEIWQGSWYAGGEPIDPYPLLRRWDSWS